MTTNAALTAKVDKMETDIGSIAANLQMMSDVMKTLHQAIPVSPTKHKDAEVVADQGVAEFEEDEIVLNHGIDLKDPAKLKWLEDEAFLNEMVTVRIGTTSDRQADPVFEIGVNGKKELFFRGQTRQVKRKFVGGMAVARPISYDNQEYQLNDGSRGVRYPARGGLRYQFSVLNDSPKGQEWLDELMKRPN